MKKILKTWMKIYGNIRYLGVALILSFIFYLINALIMEWGNIRNSGFETVSLFLFRGVYNSVEKTTFVNIIILSILTGFLVSLLIFRFRRNLMISNKEGIMGYVGMFLGVFAPGCASCGIGLAAVLGLSSSLITLPFKGLEISFFAMMMLGYAIVKVTIRIEKGEMCQIKK